MDDKTVPQTQSESTAGFNIAAIYDQDHATSNTPAVDPLVEGDPAGN